MHCMLGLVVPLLLPSSSPSSGPRECRQLVYLGSWPWEIFKLRQITPFQFTYPKALGTPLGLVCISRLQLSFQDILICYKSEMQQSGAKQ